MSMKTSRSAAAAAAAEALRAAADLGDSNAQILYATAHLAALGPSTAAAAASAAAAVADPLSPPAAVAAAAGAGGGGGGSAPLLAAGNATEALSYFCRAALAGRSEAAYSAALLLLQGASPFHKTLQSRCDASFKVLQKVAFLHRRMNLLHALSLHAQKGGDITGALLLQLLLSETGFMGGHANAAALWQQAAAHHAQRLPAVEALMEELLTRDLELAAAARAQNHEGSAAAAAAAAAAAEAATASDSSSRSSSAQQEEPAGAAPAADAAAAAAKSGDAPGMEPQQQQQQEQEQRQEQQQQQQRQLEETEEGVHRVLLERYADPSQDLQAAAAAAAASAGAAAAAAAVEAGVAAAGGTCGVGSRVSPLARAAPQRQLAAGDFKNLSLNLSEKCGEAPAAAAAAPAAAAAAAARSVLQQLRASEFVHCWLTPPKLLEMPGAPPAVACAFAALRRGAVQGDVASMVRLSELYTKVAKAATSAVSAAAAVAAAAGDAQAAAQQLQLSLHAAETAEAVSRFWALRAASTGDGRGLFVLARLQEEGIGGAQQREAATKVYWALASDPSRPAGSRLLGVWGLLRAWWQWEWELLLSLASKLPSAAARWLNRSSAGAAEETEAVVQGTHRLGIFAAARRFFGSFAAAGPPSAAAHAAEAETLDRHPILLVLSLYFAREEDRRFWTQLLLALLMLLTWALLAIQLAMRVPEMRAAAAAAAAPAAAAPAAAAPSAPGSAAGMPRQQQPSIAAARGSSAAGASAASAAEPKPSATLQARAATAADAAAAESSARAAPGVAAAQPAAAAPAAPRVREAAAAAASPDAASPSTADAAAPQAAAASREAQRLAQEYAATPAAAAAAAAAAAESSGSSPSDEGSRPLSVCRDLSGTHDSADA
ncbi:hypothetical protein Esti_006454 [Eimeria stiedai]